MEIQADENIKPNKDQHNSFADRIATRYANFMVNRPYINLVVVLLIVIVAAIMAFVRPPGQPLPDFSEPTKGFETRGTTISGRINADQMLNSIPGLSKTPPNGTVVKPRQRRSTPVEFCDTNGRFYIDAMAIVYEADGSNLNTVANLKSICTLHNKIVQKNVNYQSVQRTRPQGNKNVPCPSYTLPNLIAEWYRRQSCQDITEVDVANFTVLLRFCAKYYRSGDLGKCALNQDCTNVPMNCSRLERGYPFYLIFHYLADKEFASNADHLKALINIDGVSLPYATSTTENVYKDIYQTSLKDLSKAKEGNVQVVAFDFYELRFSLFSNRLLTEAAFISLAMVIVLCFIWIYSGSFFIAFMTFICVIFALLLAYFLYGVVFRLPFFPFLNVTTLIFLVGIGADDAFVYVGIWNEAKELFPYHPNNEYSYYLKRWTVHALKHAVVAMFVTSCTTAGAFFATVTSNITAIKCFSIYAGTSILTNYLLMVVLFPVVVILHEKYFIACTHSCMPACCPPRVDMDPGPGHIQSISIDNNGLTRDEELNTAKEDQNKEEHNKFRESKPPTNHNGIKGRLNAILAIFFEKQLPFLVYKLRYVSILLFLGLGIGGIVVIFHKPKLNLPLTQDFQMFSSSSPLAQYSTKYKKRFAFGQKSSGFFMFAKFIFGLKPGDNRNAFNPDDKGSAELKPSFSISSKEQQLWLRDFCTDLRNSSFVQSRNIPFCIEYRSLWNVLGAQCGVALSAPCCNLTEPTSPAVYDYCLKLFTTMRPSRDLGIRFDNEGKIRVMQIGVPLKFQYQDAFEYNQMVYNTIEDWSKPRMEKAPGGYKDGFWVSDFGFYDLQSALARGTQASLGIAVAIAFAVVLLTTWNPLVSFYAILAIAFVIAVTVGVLVLAGWRLNIMESIVFSVAAGLSIDFTLHYGVAYQSSPDKTDRVKRVNHSITHIGAAVTMGAITTFVAGLAMAPATVLAYIQMSHFLMLVMTVSWFYATFFFLPLCAVAGPTGNFCQLSLRRVKPSTGEQKQSEETLDIDMKEVPSTPAVLIKRDSTKEVPA